MENKIARQKISFLILACCLIQPAATLLSQPLLNFYRIGVQWPQINLFLQVKCGSDARYDLTQQNFRIKENGALIQNFTLQCPDPNIHSCMSVALVFDRSASMGSGTPSGLECAKNAGKTFVDSMIAHCDEATVISFNQNVTIDASMMQNKDSLKQAIDAMLANGGTALWDAAVTGIQEVANKGTNECKAIILLTDGEDNSSNNSVDDLISIAIANGVRVFTITLGSGINDADASRIAADTGGRYYKVPQPLQLLAVYQEIYGIISRHFDECEISYTAKCPDGTRRNVELQFSNLTGCTGVDTKTKSYKTALDTSNYSFLLLKLGSETIHANNDFEIPFILDTPIDDVFKATSFRLYFDNQNVSFLGIKTDGFLFAKIPITTSLISGGVQFETSRDTLIQGSGILCLFRFRAKDPLQDVVTPLSISVTNKSAAIVRCMNPIFQNGSITITSRQPKLDSCEMIAIDNVMYDKYSSTYDPSPIQIDVTVNNSGDREAKNVQAEISFDASAFQLVKGQGAKKSMTPNSINPNWSGTARWNLEALPRASKASFPISVTITSDNHSSITCTKNISIDPVPPILSPTIDPVSIRYDRAKSLYVPMPFQLNVHVKNIGYQSTNLAQAEIILPTELSLDPSERGMTKKFVMQSTLAHNESGDVSWLVTHPITLEEKKYIVTVRSFAANADTVDQTIEIDIPAMEGPQFQCNQMTIPSAITFDTSTKKYFNNPFIIEYSATNNGGLDADSVRATIDLPSGFALDPPTQSATQYFNPMKIVRWKLGLPQNKISWSVRALPHYVSSFDTIKIKINGNNPLHLPMDELICSNPIAVDAFGLTKISCSPIGVDSVTFSQLLGLTPNPFTICYILKNESLLSITIDTASIVQALSGVVLESITNTTHTTLQAGESKFVCAQFRASGMQVQRIGQIYLDYGVHESVMEKDQCTKSVFIDSSKIGPNPILTMNTTMIDSIPYDCASKKYVFDTFTASTMLVNSGNAKADNLTIKIELPAVFEFVIPSDSIKTISTILPLTYQQLDWQLRLRTPLSVDSTFEIQWKLFANQQEIITQIKNIFVADTMCPSVSFSSSMVSFKTFANDTTQQKKQVIIGSKDGTPFEWNATMNVTWITLSMLSGKTGDTITLQLDSRYLAAGKYKGEVYILVPQFALYAVLPIECEVKSSISDVSEAHQTSFYLGQNYPNPFTQSTIVDLTSPQRVFDPTLSYEERVITAGDRVRSFKVYDIFGREVLDLSNEARNNSTLKIQNSQLPCPGIYFYRLTIGKETQTKMMVMR